MKKPDTLSPLQSNQIKAYLLTFKPGEPVPLCPDGNWHNFTTCALTPAAFRKSLNTLAEGGYGTFSSHPGNVNFRLNEKGRQWLEGGDL